MSRRPLDQDLAAVRGLLAAGRRRVGELDDYWLNSARRRLESVDELLIRAAGGLGGWARTSIGAAAMLVGALLTAVATRAAGMPAFAVVVCSWVVAAVVEVPVRRGAARRSATIARRRLDRLTEAAVRVPADRMPAQGRPAQGVPADGVPAGGVADLPELLGRARVRLVSAALRQAGSRHWRVPCLRRMTAGEPAMFFLARADELLCQSIDYLEHHLAADRKDPDGDPLDGDRFEDSRLNGDVLNGLVSDGLVSDGLVSDGLVSDGLVSDGLVFNGHVFDGDVEHRLRRAGRRVRAAALDAQARDWLAERPDRLGFARLGQAHWEITVAAGRYGRPLPPDWVAQLGGGAARLATAVTVLLVGGASSLPVLAGAVAAGPFAAQAVVSGTAWAQRRRATRARDGTAPIDDPGLHADLVRRLEACAAAARADRSDQHRAAAGDIARALDWLSLAQRDR